jgi:hypothetical protein
MMDLDDFFRAKWIGIYTAFIAARAQADLRDGKIPCDEDMRRHVRAAVVLANMAARVNDEPER